MQAKFYVPLKIKGACAMASEHDEFILTTLKELVSQVSSANTKIDNLDRRLYNGGGGDIPKLTAEMAKVKDLAQGAKDAATKTGQKLARQRAYVAGYAGGAAGVIL